MWMSVKMREKVFLLPAFLYLTIPSHFISAVIWFCVHTLFYFLEARKIFNEKLMNVHIKLDPFFN